MAIIPRIPSVTLLGDKGASAPVKTDVDKHSGKIAIGVAYIYSSSLYFRDDSDPLLCKPPNKETDT